MIRTECHTADDALTVHTTVKTTAALGAPPMTRLRRPGTPFGVARWQISVSSLPAVRPRHAGTSVFSKINPGSRATLAA